MVDVVVVDVVVVVAAFVVVDGLVTGVAVIRVEIDDDNVGRIWMTGGGALLACPFTEGFTGRRIGPGRLIFISSSA